ncbi:MAG: FGGY family carbohydrate kinase [Homoserinimonas sp.]
MTQHKGGSAMISTVLGVDIGTSSSKGVLVDSSGRIIRSATREHQVNRPISGQVEMGASTWWGRIRADHPRTARTR